MTPYSDHEFWDQVTRAVYEQQLFTFNFANVNAGWSGRYF